MVSFPIIELKKSITDRMWPNKTKEQNIPLLVSNDASISSNCLDKEGEIALLLHFILFLNSYALASGEYGHRLVI